MKPHCGVCNCEWTEGHEKTPLHMHLQLKFEQLMQVGTFKQEEVEKALREERARIQKH